MQNEKTGKARGGYARAEKLTQEERKAIARKAAHSRWDGDLPLATHEGEFPIGESIISCANLLDGKRIITQATFLRALGRSRSPKAGTGVLSTVDELPFFLQAEVIKPFINQELQESTKAIFYRKQNGGRGVGYNATLLPKVAEVYLKFRDWCIEQNKEIPKRYEHIITASDILMRGLAHVGIIALVDEATGYQKDRIRAELAKILEAFVAKELQPWVKTFPAEFYEQLFRLRGLPSMGNGVKRPQYFGYLTNDIIYTRLAPGVLKELKEKAEKNEKGRLKHKLFQKLTPDLGHPKLRDLLSSVTTIMKLSTHWWDFKEKLNKIHPAYNQTLLLPFDNNNDDGIGI
jgi:hypothetical protein